VLAAAIAHPICNLLFRCGCGPLSLAAHCNIHLQEPGALHCPWCAVPWRFGAAIGLWSLGAWLGIALARRWLGERLLPSVAFGLVGLMIGALVSGALTVALTGYPRFLL
jgi:hypothetical protein